jgi:hypothetical protein
MHRHTPLLRPKVLSFEPQRNKKIFNIQKKIYKNQGQRIKNYKKQWLLTIFAINC